MLEEHLEDRSYYCVCRFHSQEGKYPPPFHPYPAFFNFSPTTPTQARTDALILSCSQGGGFVASSFHTALQASCPATLTVPGGWGEDRLSQDHGQEPWGISRSVRFTVLRITGTHLPPPPILCPHRAQPPSWQGACKPRVIWLLRSATMIWSLLRSGILKSVRLQHLHTSPVSTVTGNELAVLQSFLRPPSSPHRSIPEPL